ncbi:MAG: RagB/SusD family nutrient uptake outer membrane protein [Dysgonamonadaceae bacterium]|jgi:hypothetical protein|nr:RagB/SusD family nutrient uptake outer membrane protein [Dysgonamonadaceae bacterium]
MKQFKYILFSIAIGAAFNLTSCSDDFLDTTPTESVSAVTISETLDGLYIALNGIHRNMVSQFLENQGMGGEPGFMICREAEGDDFTWDVQTWHQTYLQWAPNKSETSSYNAGFWRTYYQFILNANLILEGLEKNFANSSDPMAKYIKGEALCIRAWSHFNLVQLYAKRYEASSNNTQDGIPYRESSEIVPIARNSVNDVYQKINADLDNAIALLDGYEPYDVTHYSQAAAYGLKARVTLAQQNYTDAAAAAVAAINAAEATGATLMTKNQLMGGFADITTNTKEAIYAAKTLNDQTVYFYSFYAYMGWNFNSSSNRTGIKCISSTTYDLMSATDLRRQWWDPTGTASVPSSSYNKRVYQHRKFMARSTADPVGDVAFMRLSEMYLTAAEAYARAGNDLLAKQYLKKFVAERDPSYTDSSNSGVALAEEIMNHRRIELWGEGFRWFDLKRLHLDVHRTGTNYNISFAGFLDKDKDAPEWVYEIPKAETDYNLLCTKNHQK